MVRNKRKSGTFLQCFFSFDQDKLESHLDDLGRDLQQRLTQLEDVYLKEVHSLGGRIQVRTIMYSFSSIISLNVLKL